MGQRDYYEVLGVSSSASPEEIKRAYRRLAKKHHPDRNPDDASAGERFKEIQEAYDVLGDAEKKEQYDRFGRADGPQWQHAPGSRHTYTSSGAGPTVNIEDVEDIFRHFAGGGPESTFESFFSSPGKRRRGGPRPRRRDVDRPVNLSFEQAAHGAMLEIDVPGTNDTPHETIKVKIPAGVRDGQRIRVKNRGQSVPGGGPPGDLYLVCYVRPHKFFQREGLNLILPVPVSISEAVLGGKVELPALGTETVTVTIPPGTSSGTKLRLKGKGLRDTRTGKQGDMLAEIRIVLPENLKGEKRKRLEELAELLDYNPRDKLEW